MIAKSTTRCRPSRDDMTIAIAIEPSTIKAAARWAAGPELR